jgi:hypothetical protein
MVSLWPRVVKAVQGVRDAAPFGSISVSPRRLARRRARSRRRAGPIGSWMRFGVCDDFVGGASSGPMPFGLYAGSCHILPGQPLPPRVVVALQAEVAVILQVQPHGCGKSTEPSWCPEDQDKCRNAENDYFSPGPQWED